MCKLSKHCPHTDSYIIGKDETYIVKGEPITIEASVRVCQQCHEDIFDMELDSENLRQAYQKYKQIHGLLMASDIIRIRKKYKLSQRTFAKLIGCTQATLVRYEKGAIQNDTHNRLIYLLDSYDNMAEMFAKVKGELSEKEIEKIALLLDNGSKATNPYYNIFKKKETYPQTEYSGFQRFNFDKIKNMIIYFAQNQVKLYKTKLLKLLWYTDALNFSRTTKSISGLTYIHLTYGPVPEDRDELLGLLEKMGAIRIEVDTSTSYTGECIETDAKFDDSLFSAKELRVLQEVNQKFLNYSATDMVKLSHVEAAYINTAMQEKMSFSYAFDLQGIS